ncbi:hypothetical protein C8J55DRAFT_433894, partial [Lentinula edodes]
MQPLDALAWTPVDSPAVLERVSQAIREVTVPSWISKPSEYIGLPRAGTPKADNWRRLFSIFLPLALLSMWQVLSRSTIKSVRPLNLVSYHLLIDVFKGQFESTLLHSFCKGSAFRRWLLRPNCPPLLKVLRQLLVK